MKIFRILFLCAGFLFGCFTPLRTNGASLTVQILTAPLKNAAKQTAKKEAKAAIKAEAKATAKGYVGKAAKQTAKKNTAKKLSLKPISKKVLSSMTKEQRELFQKKGYRQFDVLINGKKKPLLVSKDFDPNLKISREYTGDFDPVKYHGNDQRYVVDGCETNLGRMKRGCAPLFKDPTNKNSKWCGYSEFDLHHGGQKADPEYFALMGKEHSTESKILHTNPRSVKSEINRNEFSKKERSQLYKDLANMMWSNTTTEANYILK